MLIVYTGDGKGKTSACVGQTVRALAQGLDPVFGQFMKRPGEAGEQKMLAELLGDNFFAGGAGFFRRQEDFAEHRAAALAVLAWAGQRLEAGRTRMLILDETLYALSAGLITRRELEELIASCSRQGTHLVLSGRGLPDWLKEAADLVSEIAMLKHPYGSGVKAQPGIEF